MSRTPSLYRAIKWEREKTEKTGEDNRPNPFCAHVKIFLATATSKTNVYTHKTRTRQRRIFLIRLSRPRFTFHTEKKYEEKISFFLGFVFISFRFFLFLFYLYVFFLSLFFFSAKLTKLEHRHSFPLVMFYSRGNIRHNIFWLTFNPYSFDIFVISTYFITTSYSIRKFMITVIPSSPSSCRHSATTETRSLTISISKHLFIQMISLIFY